jgi:hypothetical protein
MLFGGSSHNQTSEKPYTIRSLHRRRLHETEIDLWSEPDSKPIFTFMLRPRLIQEGIGCKLICCVGGKPPPKVNSFN